MKTTAIIISIFALGFCSCKKCYECSQTGVNGATTSADYCKGTSEYQSIKDNGGKLPYDAVDVNGHHHTEYITCK